MQVQEIGRPEGVGPEGQIRRGEAEAGEAHVVVGEVPRGVAVGGTTALVEVGRKQHVDAQAIRRLDEAEIARGNARETVEARHHRNVGEGRPDLRVAGNQDADVVVRPQRPGEGGRDLAEAAGLHEIRHLGVA